MNRQYGIQLLDDLHTYFPDILYNSQQFQTVPQLLTYIQNQIRNRVDLFQNARNTHVQPNIIYDNSFNTPRRQPVLFTPPRLQRQGVLPQDEQVIQSMLSQILANVGTLNSDINIIANFEDRIPIYPTQEQIEQATIMRMATVADESSTCSICQDNFANGQAIRKIVQCSHEYHRGCIDTWLQSNVQCPICRHDVRTHS